MLSLPHSLSTESEILIGNLKLDNPENSSCEDNCMKNNTVKVLHQDSELDDSKTNNSSSRGKNSRKCEQQCKDMYSDPAFYCDICLFNVIP